jgi:hypothetical protein
MRTMYMQKKTVGFFTNVVWVNSSLVFKRKDLGVFAYTTRMCFQTHQSIFIIYWNFQ